MAIYGESISENEERIAKEKKEKKALEEICNRERIEILNSHKVKCHAGLLKGEKLSLTKDNSTWIVHSTESFISQNPIKKRIKSSVVSIEEVRGEAKKSMAGSIAKGIALGWLTGGAGLIAGATSGNYENVIFILNLPGIGEVLCEAKQEFFKKILAHSSRFANEIDPAITRAIEIAQTQYGMNANDIDPRQCVILEQPNIVGLVSVKGQKIAKIDLSTH